MAEVAQHRTAHARVCPHRAQGAPLQLAHARQCAGRVTDGQVQQHTTECRQCGHAQHQRGPGQGVTKSTQRVRARRTHHQRRDQQAQCAAQALAVPLSGDLHAHGVDAGEEEAGGEAPQQQGGVLAHHPPGAHGAGRARQRADQEHQARREAVGNGQQREHQRARDEAELQRRGERAHGAGGPAQLALQIGHDRVDREPERGARELGKDQDGEDVAGDRGRVHRAQLNRARWDFASVRIKLRARVPRGSAAGTRRTCPRPAPPAPPS